LTRWQRALLALGAVIGLALGVACELVVGLDELSDRKCPLDEKRCDDRCVSRMSPATGCNAPSCGPCVLPHATAHCVNGECTVLKCNEGYDDCDSREQGCETDINHDPNHCGGCFPAEACRTTNGTPGCSAGKCATGGCRAGWRDCNGQWQDGCETDVTTSSNCGACRAVCPAGTTCGDGGCA
jgi:hypothetical protein